MAVHQTVSLAQTEIAQTVASDILRTETSLRGKFTEFTCVTQRGNKI